MVKLTYSKHSKITEVDDDCVVLMSKLQIYYKNEDWTEFPRLNGNIYKWSIENKCRYKRTNHLSASEEIFARAILFENVEAANRFKERWIDCVIYFNYWSSVREYEFLSDKYDHYDKVVLTKEAYNWCRQNKVKIVERNFGYFIFNSPESAMAFKLAWL